MITKQIGPYGMYSEMRNCFVSSLFLIFAGCFCFSQKAPKVYVAHQCNDSIVIDGQANETSWQGAPWSDSYTDIEGVKTPKYDTKMKLVWDTEYLYFFAKMEEPHVWGTLKERDTVIFYNNDFEIFIDPDGDTHNYYELEVNVLNTVWDLFLSKPYRNNGTILGAWDFKGLKSAVSVQGTLNDSGDIDKGWQIEIAIPWSFKTPPGHKATVPKAEFWRMNFSRVNWGFDLENGRYTRAKDQANNEYLPEYNWVWSPQGVINMHEPEHWGYVFFSETLGGESENFKIPDDEHIKWFLYELYRLQLKKGALTSFDLVEKTIRGKVVVPKVETHGFGRIIWAKSPFTNQILRIGEDGKFEISGE